MKKYFFIFAAILFSGSFGFAQTTQQKIGYVDSQVILAQFPEAIKAQGDLDALTGKWGAHIDTLTQQLQKDYADYQKQAKTMPEDKQLAAQQKLLQQQQEIDNYKKEKFGQPNGQIYKKNEEIFGPVKEKVYKAIQSVAKEEGMQFVLDKAGDAIVLYADTNYDITYKVLDRLKRGSTK
ncbi:MAG TPA: OmpH family outer membrane protein [Ignavibacteriaceae bacterium]|nr:OmpH family outer membrane protein [Ignavibacteriaceae bacterium]